MVTVHRGYFCAENYQEAVGTGHVTRSARQSEQLGFHETEDRIFLHPVISSQG